MRCVSFRAAILLPRAAISLLRAAILLLIAAIPLLTACTSRSTPVSHSFRIYEEDGVTVAETTGGPKYQEELFRYEKVLEIRPDPEIKDSFLGQFITPKRGEDGFFYILDWNHDRIAVFDQAGRYVQDIGREGGGPGEYLSATYFTIRNSLITVSSFPPLKATRFRQDGSLVDVTTLRFPEENNIVPHIERVGADTLVVFTWRREQDEEFQYIGVRATVLKGTQDTIATIETPLVKESELVTISRRVRGEIGRREYKWPSRIYYQGNAVLFLAPSGVLYSTTGIEPWIRIYSLDGRLQRRIELDLPPIPLSSELRQPVIDHLQKELRDARSIENPQQRESGVEFAERSLSNAAFADSVAFWTWALTDESGFFWLKRGENLQLDYWANYGDRYRVIDPSGEYLGDTVWPPLNDGDLSGGFLLGIFVDPETDEQIPTIYRIIPAVPGLEYP